MIISDKIYINTAELGYQTSNLCELFTYKNPEIYHKKRLKLSIKDIPIYLYHYKLSNDNGQKILELPRGGLQRVIKFYEENGIPLRMLDQRMQHKEIDVELNDTVLDKHQTDLINILAENEGGLIEASPGMGKSITILGLIAKIKQPTLILMHEFRLSNQWYGEIQKRLSGTFTLGKYDGDVKQDGDIVVGIINSIYNKHQEDPEFFRKFGMVVQDEVHRCPTTMFLSVLNNIPAKYRIGVTGTIKRKDQKEILTYDIMGDVLKKLGSHDLKNRITNFEYKVVHTNFDMELPRIKRWTGRKKENVLDMTSGLTALLDNPIRNNIIIYEAVKCIEAGYFPLILSDRVAHNELLHERLCALNYKTVLLIGKTRKKTKWAEIREDETIQCIVANTKIASEGLDLPRLSAIIITCPSSNVFKLEQQIGRIRRFLPGKILPLVIDICDNHVYIEDERGKHFLLSYMAKKRLSLYNKLIMEYETE